jgi:hypothetical protein
MTWEEWQKRDIRALLWIMHARNERIEDHLLSVRLMIQKSLSKEVKLMSIVDDLKSDIDAMKTEIEHNSDLADAGAQAINKLVDQVSHMGDSAQDLATLQADLRDWTSHVKANSDKIGAAIANVPSDSGGTGTGGDTGSGGTGTGTGDTGSGGTGTGETPPEQPAEPTA